MSWKDKPCPHCGTKDLAVHSFLCWNHPTPYIYGANLMRIGRKDGKPMTKKEAGK